MEELLKDYCNINVDVKDDECLLFTAVDMQNFALKYHNEQLRLLSVGKSVKEKNMPSDTELLDWLQKIMTNDDDYCEIFFAGLRDFQSGKATSFQIESNPEKFPTLNAKNIRAVIKEAMTFIGN